jgi:hypothetical protein
VIVETENSVYVIDVEDETVTRVAREGDLRRDGEKVPLLALEDDPVVGMPMVMLLAIRSDGVRTVRITSPVVRVEP